MTARESLVQYSSGGMNMHGFLARPGGDATVPGLLVIQEWWGLNEHIRDITRRCAAAGYVALAPDLYSRRGHVVTTDPAQAAQLMESLKAQDARQDLLNSLTFLAGVTGADGLHLGVIGFCMGGSYALQLACASIKVRAAVAFYGQIPDDNQLRQLRCPVLYVYGGRDEWVPRDDVERLRQMLQKQSLTGTVQIYDECGHAFFNDTRPDVHNAKATKDAWQKTLAFLKEHLRS